MSLIDIGIFINVNVNIKVIFDLDMDIQSSHVSLTFCFIKFYLTFVAFLAFFYENMVIIILFFFRAIFDNFLNFERKSQRRCLKGEKFRACGAFSPPQSLYLYPKSKKVDDLVK
jgi:hypothetical protein